MYCRVPHFAAHSTGSSCAQNSIVSSASRVCRVFVLIWSLRELFNSLGHCAHHEVMLAMSSFKLVNDSKSGFLIALGQ